MPDPRTMTDEARHWSDEAIARIVDESAKVHEESGLTVMPAGLREAARRLRERGDASMTNDTPQTQQEARDGQ